jgi:hypothetical protein
MKKAILLVGLFLVAFNGYAGVCNNGTLTGAYNFNVSGVNIGQGIHGAGRINFNGKGATGFSGIDTTSGAAVAIVGSGTYAVTPSCTVSGIIRWTNGVVTNFWMYLDRIDGVPAVNVAYHGSVVLKNNVGESGSGTLDRVIGKF